MAFLHFYTEAKNKHSIIANATQRRTQASPRDIVAFLDELEAQGVTVTHAPQFRALTEYEPAAYSDPDPLATDPATAHEAVTEHAVRVTATRGSSAWSNYLAKAGHALLASMAVEADDYIMAMRPRFDAAASTIAAALALGLDQNTTYPTLVEEGTPDQITAWRAALEARATLDQIAAARISMSAWLDLLPQGNALYPTEVPDYTPAFMVQAAPIASDKTQISGNALTHRWLYLQNSEGTALKLNTIADLNAVGYERGHGVS